MQEKITSLIPYLSNFMLTTQLFNSIFPVKGLNPKIYNLVRYRAELIEALNRILPKYGITTAKRVRAFLATCGIETDYFKTSIEYASGADYEGRRDLGNVRNGDGRRFPGRSIIQTTGRFNYWRVTVRVIKKKTGVDWSHPLAFENFSAYLRTEDYAALLKEADRLNCNYLAHPEMLAEVETAVEAASIFWEENNLNDYADKGTTEGFRQLNGIVNKGSKFATPLHWSKRNELYSLLIRRIPNDFVIKAETNLVSPATNQPVDETNPGVSANPPSGTSQTDSSTSDPKTEGNAEISAKELAKKYLIHCPKDKIKNILAVIGLRIFGSVTSLWAYGLHGQILLIVAGLIAVCVIGYAIYYYGPRIFKWVTGILDELL